MGFFFFRYGSTCSNLKLSQRLEKLKCIGLGKEQKQGEDPGGSYRNLIVSFFVDIRYNFKRDQTLETSRLLCQKDMLSYYKWNE